MIIVQMMGQLGNQLFIYAMARALQKKYGGKIYIDLAGLKRHYYSAQYKLSDYNIPKDIVTYDLSEIDTKIYKRYIRYTRLFHLEQRILRILHPKKQISDSVTERWFKRGCFFNFNRNWFNYKQCNVENKMVYGYFQSEKYFESVKDDLIRELCSSKQLTENEKALLDSIKLTESVGVSIRISNSFKNVQSFISKEYYVNGVEYLLSINPKLKFFVFSDNIDAVKKEIEFPVPVVYVEPSSSVTGLHLLSKCKHFVLANSTFSWWGAYLSEYSSKMIIMPDPWDKERNREDIYFSNCIRIPCTFSEEVTEYGNTIK